MTQHTSAPDSARLPDLSRLPEWMQGMLLLVFGASCMATILFFARSHQDRLDLLLLGVGLGAIATAGLWITLLGLRRSTGWALALCAAIWIPYVNFVVVSIYARRYWADGGRTPALLAIGGMVVQSLASLRMLLGAQPPVV